MGVGAGLYMYDIIVKSSRSLTHLKMSFLLIFVTFLTFKNFYFNAFTSVIECFNSILIITPEASTIP